MNGKSKGLLIDAVVYTAAFAAACIPFVMIDGIFAATAAFTATATVLIFVASVIMKDVSVYDPYWSVAPPVMILADMIKYRLWNVNSAVLLGLITVWSLRLTVNWYSVYRGPGNEDWRYAAYREKYPPAVFLLISFFGFQLMPTAVVYAGLVGTIYSIGREDFAPLSLVGICVMIAAVLLEAVSDISIHRFLRENKCAQKTCDVSVWRYSRHPNYLGEILFWTGLYLYFAVLCPVIWYKGLWFLSIIALFLFVSIPMMEKHNLDRRPDYAGYKSKTSMLLPFPRAE